MTRLHRALCLAATLLLTATGVAQAHTCNWEDFARSEDKARIAMQFDDARQRIGTLRGEGVDRASKAAALALLRRAARPAPLGSITGAWKVRSLQFTDNPGVYDFGYAYPFFRARISHPSGCALEFAKTSGSQRRAGQLYPMSHDKRTLAFLGTTSVNSDPVRPYDTRSADPANSAGRLVRLDRDELLMLLDFGGRGFELYHLKR